VVDTVKLTTESHRGTELLMESRNQDCFITDHVSIDRIDDLRTKRGDVGSGCAGLQAAEKSNFVSKRIQLEPCSDDTVPGQRRVP